MTGLNRKNLIVTLGAVTTLIVVAFVFGPARTRILAYQFSSATTPASELAVSRRINHWQHSYSVEAFDLSGSEIFPHRTGDYDTIHSIRIIFPYGVTARRTILDPRSLSYIYGE